MAKTGMFDPNTLVEDQLALTRTADAAHASTFKHQTFLHRQRVGAAKVRLNRAMQRGAPQSEIDALQAQVLVREARLQQVETQFGAADIVSPAPSSDMAQVLGQVTGDAGQAPYTAALISPEGEVLTQVKVTPNGGFVLAQGGQISGALLQVSDSTQTILFRDAKPFNVAPGQILSRTVELTAPAKPAAPAPTVLSMPDVTGQTEEAACAILFRLGVREIDLVKQADPGPAGLVLAQEPPAGSVLVPEQGAKLTVSQTGVADPAPTSVFMPDMIGRDIGEAREIAKELEIKLAEISRPGDAAEGEVIGQSPPEGTELQPPLQATVVFSEGAPQGIQVPDVVGQPAGEADAMLREAGLVVQRRTVRQDGTPGVIVDQQPKGGTTVVLPASVLIVINLGAEEEPVEVVVPQLTDRSVNDATRIASSAGLSVRRTSISRDGPTGVVLNQSPEAGSRVRLPATVTIMANSGATIARPTRTAVFPSQLTTEIMKDDRSSRIGLDDRSTSAMVARLGVRNQRDLDRLIEMDNAQLTERAGLENQNQARTLRSILRGAKERMG